MLYLCMIPADLKGFAETVGVIENKVGKCHYLGHYWLMTRFCPYYLLLKMWPFTSAASTSPGSLLELQNLHLASGLLNQNHKLCIFRLPREIYTHESLENAALIQPNEKPHPKDTVLTRLVSILVLINSLDSWSYLVLFCFDTCSFLHISVYTFLAT